MEDLQIIELYFARDEKAIGETHMKYGKLCYKVAHSLLKNNEDSEECLNDAYLVLWNSIPPAFPENFTAYICKIVQNIALKRLEFRHTAKRAAYLISFSELEEQLMDQCFNITMEEKELQELIFIFLQKERDDVRNVFIRKYLYLESVDEIAERNLGSISKVKNMLYQIRKRLKKYLMEEGIQI